MGLPSAAGPGLARWLAARQVGPAPRVPWHPAPDPLALRGLPYQRPLEGHAKCVNTLAFSPTDRFLASGGDDQQVLLWDAFSRARAPRPVKALLGHAGIILCAAWDTPAGAGIVSCDSDGMICLFDVEHGTHPTAVYAEHDDSVQKVAFQPGAGSALFISASSDSTVRLWDSRAPGSQGRLSGLCPFTAAAFCPTSPDHFLTCDQGSGLLLWDLRCAFGPPSAAPAAPSLASNMAAAQRARRRCVRIYRAVHRHAPSGALLAPEISAVDFARNGQTFVCSVRKGGPLVFRTAEDRPLAECHAPGYANTVTQKTPAFVGDGDQLVACGSDDWGVYLWALEDAEAPANGTPMAAAADGSGARLTIPGPRLVLRGHHSIVNAVAWNRAVPLLATSGVERTIKVWQPWPFTREDALGTAAPFVPRPRLSLADAERIAHRATPVGTEEAAAAAELRTLALFDYYTQRYESDSDADPSSLDTSDEDDGGGDGPEGDPPTATASSSSSSSPSVISGGEDAEEAEGGGWAEEQRLYRRAAAWHAMRAMVRRGSPGAPLHGPHTAAVQRSMWDVLEPGGDADGDDDLLAAWPWTADSDSGDHSDSDSTVDRGPPPSEAAADHRWAVEGIRRMVVARWGPRPPDPTVGGGEGAMRGDRDAPPAQPPRAAGNRAVRAGRKRARSFPETLSPPPPPPPPPPWAPGITTRRRPRTHQPGA